MLQLVETEISRSASTRQIAAVRGVVASQGADDLPIRLFKEPSFSANKLGDKLPAKAFQLVAFLSFEPDFSASRRKVASLLWDGPSDQHAFNNLRQLIARIRRAVPERDAISTSDSSITLGHDFRKSDLQLVLSVIERQRIEGSEITLLDLFGELLEGTDIHCSSNFLEWLSRKRIDVEDRFLNILTEYLYNLTRFGNTDERELEHLSTKMLAINPEREETYRHLIDVFGRVGNLGKARKLYTEVTSMLRTEFNAEPGGETAALARRVFAEARPSTLPIARQPSEITLPRIAILMPEWLIDRRRVHLFNSLISSVADELARYGSFQVLGPHSTLKVKHELGALAENEVLQADYTISGFVHNIYSSPVLSLRMLKGDALEVVWSAEFQLSKLELQSTHRLLTRRISASLASELEKDQIRYANLTNDPSSFAALLSGIDQMMICDLPQLRKARRYFTGALEIDRHFSKAYGGLAQCYLFEWLILGANDPTIIREARRNAEHAFDINPNDGLLISTLASIDMYQHKIDVSLERFADAEVLCPNSSELLVGHASALSTAGRPVDGLEKFEKAVSLNPILPDDHWWAGASIAFDDHQYDRAISYCSRMQNNEAALRVLAASHALSGDLELAKHYGKKLIEIYPDQTASQMVGITPIQDEEVYKRFLEGLKSAGLP